MQAQIPHPLECELNQLQQSVLAAGLPVMVIFEGSSGRVIGRVNSELIRCLEPRGVLYTHFDPSESGGPGAITDFLMRTPGKGQIGLCDRSWYSMAIERHAEGMGDLDRMLGACNDFERYLALNGVLLIKIVLRASGEAIDSYGPQYGPNAPKESFLSPDHIDPVKYRGVMYEGVCERTDTPHAPWDRIAVRGIGETVLETAETIAGRIRDRLAAGPPSHAAPEIERRYPNPRKGAAPPKKCKSYEETMSGLSDRLGRLQMDLSLSGRSMAVCFEGWDAAGKGSCIKHLCHALNPRGYEVIQTKAPTAEELAHTHLWRFCRGIPQKGRITVFDRTWYGRMMVEPAEGFCTEEEYRRSPFEINAFERMMTDSGVMLLKFWLDITPDEQLARFEKRAGDPLKQWKLTDEDWRNRAKRDVYEGYVDAMIESTNTENAPWTVVDANSKKHARVKVLGTVAGALERGLGQ